MGKVFFATYPMFREGILELDAIYERVTGSSLVKTTGLFSKVDGLAVPSPRPVKITLLAMTVFQISMTDLLATIGIKPTAVVGYSAGETPMIYGGGAGPRVFWGHVRYANGCFEGKFWPEVRHFPDIWGLISGFCPMGSDIKTDTAVG